VQALLDSIWPEFRRDYHSFACSRCRRPDDAEDALSETYLRAVGLLPGYSGGVRERDAREPMFAWLRAILWRVCYEQHRRHEARARSVEEIAANYDRSREQAHAEAASAWRQPFSADLTAVEIHSRACISTESFEDEILARAEAEYQRAVVDRLLGSADLPPLQAAILRGTLEGQTDLEIARRYALTRACVRAHSSLGRARLREMVVVQ